MNKAIYVLGILAVCMALSTMIPASYAFYTISLEEQLQLAERAKAAAVANPATGSGTPYMDANGVVGASVIVGVIFGGIATVFFLKGRSGRYAAYGRG